MGGGAGNQTSCVSTSTPIPSCALCDPGLGHRQSEWDHVQKMKDKVDVLSRCSASGVQASKSLLTLGSSQYPSWESVLWDGSTVVLKVFPMFC